MFSMPPLSYNLRSLQVRWTSTLLTVVGIGSTVAVLSGILALQQGFEKLYTQSGRDDVAIFMRPGATSEGESSFRRSSATLIKKECPNIALDANNQPMASGEVFLAVRMRKLDGGETNVPIRGIEPGTLKIRGPSMKILEGKNFVRGNDEVIVGRSAAKRIANCKVGQTIQLNVTPFTVVGIFDVEGPYTSEIWGDFDRMSQALERPNYNRILVQIDNVKAMKTVKDYFTGNKRTPAKVMSEKEYLSSQTKALSQVLYGLGTILALIMGSAAVFTGMNTMFGAISARSHEIGILISIGFQPFPVFLSFVIESMILGILGGCLGCLLVLPLNGISTGTTNFQTFTEVAFAFQVTPKVFFIAMLFSIFLGFIGGLIPAYSAATADPVEALKRT